MTLQGIYEIRFVPKYVDPPFAGGVYATGVQLGAPIQALPFQSPGEKKWNVQAVQDKPDLYTITHPPVPGVFLPGFGLAGQQNKNVNEPVILTADLAQWVITEVENGLYRISEPTPDVIGAVNAVTEEDGRLLLKWYPVIPKSFPLPRWEFIAINK